MNRAIPLCLTVLLAGCKGHATFNFMKPARVTIDPSVVTLAPLDRAGEHLTSYRVQGGRIRRILLRS